MCGIVGLYNFPADPEILPRMLKSIAHRGPDADGVYASNAAPAKVALGHRRLSIIDLSAEANQPFEKDGLVLVYNGEIYNYAALKRELEAEGVGFRTNSDTEVLLEAWRRWGLQGLKRLRGMFAFALFDERTGKLTLARDPFGIKPLFLARRRGGLAFASELKALCVALGDDLKLNPTALISSLMYYWIPETHCVYQGVEKLPPGHVAEMDPNGDFRLSCYYDPAEELIPTAYKEIDAADLRSVIEDSVAAHLVAGRAGLCLFERWARLQPLGVDRRAPGPSDRRLHHLLSRGRPKARGDARRPLLRAQGRQSLRSQAA